MLRSSVVSFVTTVDDLVVRLMMANSCAHNIYTRQQQQVQPQISTLYFVDTYRIATLSIRYVLPGPLSNCSDLVMFKVVR